MLLLGIFVAQKIDWTLQLKKLSQNLPGANSTLSGRMPTQIRLPAISIAAPVVNLGLNSDHTIEVPSEDNAVGWYKYGAVPGDNGTAIMVGHLDSTTGPAIFWHLNDIKIGDNILITRSDGLTAVFTVSDKHSYPFDNFPSQQVYANTSYPSLQILTCTGTYSRVVHHYSENLVVSATLSQIKKSP